MKSSRSNGLVALVAGGLVDCQLDYSALQAAGLTIRRERDLQNSLDESRMIKGLTGAYAVVAGGETYSRRVLSELPGLRLVARVGVGYDRVDVAAASELGILVSITPNTIEPAVAEWTIALILAVRRRLLQTDRAVRSGQWTLPSVLSPGLVGATVGLIGLGRIGGEVVKRLAGFGCTIIATDPAADAGKWRKQQVEIVPLDALLAQSDVVSLHLSLTPATRHIVGSRELGLMRSSAVLINTSRGGLIDEEALLAALSAGRVTGAGLDTFETEPLPPGSPLLALDNVVVSGHVAYATYEAARTSAQGAVDAVAAFARGETPVGALNRQVLKPSRATRVERQAAGPSTRTPGAETL